MAPEQKSCPHCGADLPDYRDAFCPECAQPLDESPHGDTAPEGKQIGAPEGAPLSRPGLAYSPLAQVALVVGVLFALFGCAVALVLAMVSVARGDWFTGLLVCPIGFFLQLAMAVVFLRVMDLRPPAQ
jgi:hypothetical protein